MAISKIAKGLGRLGPLPTAISILYDKLKNNSVNVAGYVADYLKRRKVTGADYLKRAEALGLEDSLRDYASLAVQDARQNVSYLDNRIKYVGEAVNNGMADNPYVHHAASTARDLLGQLFSYPVKKYGDIEQRILGYSDSARSRDYVGNPIHKFKAAIDWWDKEEEWVKRLVYGIAKRVEKRALLMVRQREGLQVESAHIDAMVGSNYKALGKLRNVVKFANYSSIRKSPGYEFDFNPYGSRVYGTA